MAEPCDGMQTWKLASYSPYMKVSINSFFPSAAATPIAVTCSCMRPWRWFSSHSSSGRLFINPTCRCITTSGGESGSHWEWLLRSFWCGFTFPLAANVDSGDCWEWSLKPLSLLTLPTVEYNTSTSKFDKNNQNQLIVLRSVFVVMNDATFGMNISSQSWKIIHILKYINIKMTPLMTFLPSS